MAFSCLFASCPHAAFGREAICLICFIELGVMQHRTALSGKGIMEGSLKEVAKA